jgi:hypothetical protein
MMEKLIMCIQYECQRAKIVLPWGDIVHRLNPGSSGEAAIQFLAKERDKLIAEGHMIPPMQGHMSDKYKIPKDVRGYVHDESAACPTTCRVLRWDEDYFHPKENKKIPGVVYGSGKYKQDPEWKPKATTSIPEIVKKFQPKGSRRDRRPAELIPGHKKTAIRKRSAKSDEYDSGEQDSNATNKQPVKKRKVVADAEPHASEAKVKIPETSDDKGSLVEPKASMSLEPDSSTIKEEPEEKIDTLVLQETVQGSVADTAHKVESQTLAAPTTPWVPPVTFDYINTPRRYAVRPSNAQTIYPSAFAPSRGNYMSTVPAINASNIARGMTQSSFGGYGTFGAAPSFLCNGFDNFLGHPNLFGDIGALNVSYFE